MMISSLARPVIEKWPVTQAFGAHAEPGGDAADQALYELYRSLGLRGGHNGIDYGAPLDTPVYAAAKGKAVKAGWDSTGFGNRVLIQHEGGVQTLYGHLSMCLVHVRTTVERGQVIGRVGSTGNSTGPHLHFGLYVGGKAVDPSIYLEAEGEVAAPGHSEVMTALPVFPTLPRMRVMSELGLNIRQSASAEADWMGWLATAEVVSVMSAKLVGDDLWVMIGYDEWCAMKYRGNVYGEWVN